MSATTVLKEGDLLRTFSSSGTITQLVEIGVDITLFDNLMLDRDSQFSNNRQNWTPINFTLILKTAKTGHP